MKRVSMHIRLVAAAVLLIVATTGFAAFMGARTIQNFVQTRFEDRMKFLARYVSLNAELGILIGQKELLTQLAEKLLTEKDVIGVSVLDEKDEVLVSASKEGYGRRGVIEAPVVVVDVEDENLSFLGVDEPAQKIQRTIGKVRIVYSTDDVMRLRDLLVTRFIVVSAVLSVLGIVLFFFISRSIVRQITRLVDAARKVSQGDLKARPAPGNLPETRELTLAFNSMLDSIEWSRNAIEEAYQEMIQQNTLAELGKFSMMVAHEFKNPLGIIKGSLDHLKKAHPGLRAGNTMVEYMDEEIIRLNRLIEDFLMFSKPLKPVFRDVDLNAALSDFLERFGLYAETSRVDIEPRIPGAPCVAHADRDLIFRVLDNLMKNALEFSAEGDCIRVSAENSTATWALRITDQGPGIPEENLTQIFEPFFTTRAKGSGLGLAFVRQVVIAHGGSLRAENVTDGGACFTMTIPVVDK